MYYGNEELELVEYGEYYCKLCNRWTEDSFEMASHACCNECAEKYATLPNMLEYIKQENLESDFYVDYLMDASVNLASKELVDVCKEFFEKHCNDKLEKAKDFINTDFGEFANWLEGHYEEL